MYQDKLIDAMAQIYFNIKDEVFESYLESSGIDYIAISAGIPGGKDCSLRLKQKFNSRILLGTSKRFDQRDDFDPQYINTIIQELKDPSYRYIGELHFTHADKEDGEINDELERRVSAVSPNTKKLLDHISAYQVPVFFHWEVFHWERDWPEISKMLKSYPNLKFVWPHCGFATVDQIDKVLSEHPNVYATLSKRELKRWKNLWIGPDNTDLGGFQIVNSEWWDKVDSNSIVDDHNKIRQEWVTLIDKFQDRFLFATDAHKTLRWNSYNNIVLCWRNILGQLDADLAKKISYTNAAKLYKIS